MGQWTRVEHNNKVFLRVTNHTGQAEKNLLGPAGPSRFFSACPVWFVTRRNTSLLTSTIFLLLQQLIIQCDAYAVCYLHIKQIAISQERRAIWKNYRYVYTLRLIGPISYTGECDLIVHPRKYRKYIL